MKGFGHDMKFGFIGLGNMATAIMKGMIASEKFDATHIYGFNRTLAKTEALAEQYSIHTCTSIEQLVSQVDVIILAVKPQMLPDVLPLVRQHLRQEQIVISVAAGKTLDYLHTELRESTTIFRVMPNINAVVGASTSAYTTRAKTPTAHRQLVIEMFETIGSILELPEHLFATFTTIGCASPAFTYLYIDALARAAVREGMPKQMALEIAASSVLGSAKMILASSEHPMTLVDQVCSPGGTTIQGVTSLQGNHFEGIVHEAVAAVMARDKELSAMTPVMQKNAN